jgi:DNA-binding NtrC family response regulator
MVLKVKESYSVLLVDDDADIADLFRESLAELAFNVITVANGIEALEFLGKNTVDCIITDISMPKMSGPELIKRLQEQKNHTPFFFITGYSDYPRESLNIFKPKAIIFKPFDFEEAALLIKNHLLKAS